MRTGIGYDLHRLVEGRPMVVGGVDIHHPKGPLGHSDGDVLLHAVCDALLGAMGKGDIGMMFPDTDARYKGVSSRELLGAVSGLMHEEGFFVVNMDCIIVTEEPHIGPYREDIKNTIAGIVKCSSIDINVKAKTAEGLGDIGKGDAMSAYVSVLLDEKE